MAGGVEELLVMLNHMVQDAWSFPLGADRCVLERDKLLDLIEEITASLPADLKQARTIVESRNEVLAAAKREAESIKRTAEDRARQMVSQEEVIAQARHRANELLTTAEAKSRDIRRATNEYVEDTLKRTEDAISSALNEVRSSRSKFKQVALAKPKEHKNRQSGN